MGNAGRLQSRADRSQAKKLIEAAARLFNGCTDTDTQREALAALNVTASPLEQDAALDIWPENWSGLGVFLAMQTQWATAGMGGLLGLRYESLPFVLEMQGVSREQWPEATAAVQVLERETVALSRKR